MTEESRELTPHFFPQKPFTVNPVINKHNDWVVTFGNGVSEQHRLFTTKHPVSIIIIGIVASVDEEKFYHEGLQELLTSYRACVIAAKGGQIT